MSVAGGARAMDPAADLAMALAVTSAHRGIPLAAGTAAFGELGLTGAVRPAGHNGRRLAAAAAHGMSAAVTPPAEPGRRATTPRRRRICTRYRGSERPSRSPSGDERSVLSMTSEGARLYEVGDKVVYPHHGAGNIIKKEQKEILGQRREYLTIQILYNDMTVMVPTENADSAGLRKVIGEETVDEVLAVLRDDGTQMPKNWNRRFKHNRDKIKTGDIFELAEVVRNLSIRDLDKGLSTGEKQMFGRAKKILASELMYARDMEEQEAIDFLENLLGDIGQNRSDEEAGVSGTQALVD